MTVGAPGPSARTERHSRSITGSSRVHGAHQAAKKVSTTGRPGTAGSDTDGWPLSTGESVKAGAAANGALSAAPPPELTIAPTTTATATTTTARTIQRPRPDANDRPGVGA